MKKDAQMPDFGYTPEQIREMQEAFEKFDFTAQFSLEHKVELTGKKLEIFGKAKSIFVKYWLDNLPGLGINRQMKNFSNEYPVKLLQNTDGTYISEQIAEIYTDPERFKSAVEYFADTYEETLRLGLEGYAKSVGKDFEDLTEEEIHSVTIKVAGVLSGEFTKVLMLCQKVPEIYGVSAQIATHEDFSGVIESNYDLINFHNKWTHCKTKLGAPLLFCELSEDEATGIEGARSFFDRADENEKREYEEIREIFLKTLSSTDKEIYMLTEMGYTQAEIASRLGYKTHSAVSKRLSKIAEKLKEFTDYIEKNADQK